MNTQDSSQSKCCSCGTFLPTALIAASLLVFFIWQLTNMSGQRTALNSARQQLEDSFKSSTPQHEQMIKQSEAVQAKLGKLATDLLEVANAGDADAAAIVKKHGISKPAPSATPAQ